MRPHHALPSGPAPGWGVGGPGRLSRSVGRDWQEVSGSHRARHGLSGQDAEARRSPTSRTDGLFFQWARSEPASLPRRALAKPELPPVRQGQRGCPWRGPSWVEAGTRLCSEVTDKGKHSSSLQPWVRELPPSGASQRTPQSIVLGLYQRVTPSPALQQVSTVTAPGATCLTRRAPGPLPPSPCRTKEHEVVGPFPAKAFLCGLSPNLNGSCLGPGLCLP